MSANAIGLIMSYCISGHHSGLLDGGSKYDDNESAATLWGRLNKEVEDYSSYTKRYIVPRSWMFMAPTRSSLER